VEGNGIPDAAEFSLLQAVLQNVNLDLSRDGGVVHDFAWNVWAANLAQATADLGGVSGMTDGIIRAAAAYMTLGTYGHTAFVKEACDDAFSVELDKADYDTSRQRFLAEDHDADADGADNVEEWDAAVGDDFDARVNAFQISALDKQEKPSSYADASADD